MNASAQQSLSVARWTIQMAPGSAALRRRAAERLIEAGAAAEAADMLDELPDDMAARLLRGIALHDLGRMADAHDAFLEVTVRAPDVAAGWANLGMVAKIEGRFEQSLAAYDRAVALAPGDPRIRLNRAVALLRAGRMAEAWADYECRLQGDGRIPPLPGRMLPPVDTFGDGHLPLAGTTVLVTHEDGFGDTLQFCRYLPLLAVRGARVMIQAPRPLCGLLATLGGLAAVIGPTDRVPEFDYRVPVFSLPRVFATALDTIPAAVPYLHPDPARVAFWRARLPARRDRRLRVGVAWSGQARPWVEGFAALDRRRSLPLAAFAGLADIPGIDLVSLQAGPAAAAEIASCGFALHDPMTAVTGFDETAAIAANLDVVVSVDTSVVHLAGAIGLPVCLLDRYDSCWRWLSGRTDSPWYPGLRIFRQPSPGDWRSVMADTRDRLCRLAMRT